MPKIVMIALLICLVSMPGVQASLSGYKIGIDPGHGGTDPGAVGPTGLQEKAINLTTSLALRTYLQADQAEVYMTRTTDVTLALSTRSSYLNSIPVHRAASVHHNASSSSSPNYTGVHVYPGTCFATSGNMAYTIVHRLNAHMNIGYVWSNCSREGLHEDDFHMVRETTMPAVLTENSFISNPAEETRLRNNAYLDANGWAIYAGINDHLSTATPIPSASPTNTPSRTPTPSGSEIIIDNSDAGCSVQGSTWLVSTWGENYGADKYYSETGTGTGLITWTTAIAQAGTYNLYAWVNQGAYATDAVYTITHLGGTTVVHRTQSMLGGGWTVSLGTYSFSGSGAISISDNAGTGIVVADAVKFQLVSTFTPTPTRTPTRTPTGVPTTELIVDNTDAGCTIYGTQWVEGSWGEIYGPTKLYSSSGIGDGWVRWTATLPQSGMWELSAWVNQGAYTDQATYTITHQGGDTVLLKSQNMQGGGWSIALGTYACTTTAVVKVSDDASFGIVVADAIKFRRVGDIPQTPTATLTPTRTPTSMSPTYTMTRTPTGTPTSLSPTYTMTRTPTMAPTNTPTPVPTQPGDREARGIWVTRWDYSSPTTITTVLTNAANAGFNQVYFQVRGRADAFYESDYEPWAEELSGTLGQNPGWDPLAVAVAAAHSLGLELHAWINTYPCWSGTTPPRSTTPQHIYNAHPEWLQCDTDGAPMPLNSGYVCLSPGIPAVGDHLSLVCQDITSKYDIDGLHFDYIRYAGSQYSHDPISEDRFINDNPGGLTWGDWQRDQITLWLGRVYDELTAIDPELKVTAAVWGIYIDYWGWNTSEGFYGYYQDSRAWLEQAVIDAICPMIYWNLASIPYFGVLVDDFAANMHGRHVYVGYTANYTSFSEIANEIAYTRDAGPQGNVAFAYSYISQRGYWDDYASGPYASPALPPEMPWKSTPAATPTLTPTAYTPCSPTVTPTLTPTPQPTMPPPTVTPAPSQPTLNLILNDTIYLAGERFLLLAELTNANVPLWVDEYIILDVYGYYFFYPNWTSNLDYATILLEADANDVQTILDFIWPDGAGYARDLAFWGALLESGTINLISNLEYEVFGYE